MEKTINKVELNGFIGMNPEVKTLENGNTLTRFSIATSESYKDKNGIWIEDTTWHNVIMWGAKTNVEDLKKGSRVQIIGKLKNRQYQDKAGVTKYVTEVITTKIETVKA